MSSHHSQMKCSSGWQEKEKKKDFSPVDVRKETSSVNVPQISTQTYST